MVTPIRLAPPAIPRASPFDVPKPSPANWFAMACPPAPSPSAASVRPTFSCPPVQASANHRTGGWRSSFGKPPRPAQHAVAGHRSTPGSTYALVAGAPLLAVLAAANTGALVQIDCMGKRIPDAAPRLQAPSTAFQTADAARP